MIVATCYQYNTASDTMTAKTGTDAGGAYDLDNLMSTNLTLRGRLTSANDFYGMEANLAAAVTTYCVEAVNDTIYGGESARIFIYSDAAKTTVVHNTTFLLFPQSVAYSAHSYLEDVPSRHNTIVGIDYSNTAPSLTGSLASVSARVVTVDFQDKETARTFWEVGYLAIGTNGLTITAPSSMSIHRVALRHGWGWRCEVRWDVLPITEATYLESMKAATHDGSLPCFLFPYPGTRNNAGLMVDPDASRPDETYVTPAHRGGLSRLLDFSYSSTKDLGTQPDVTDAALSFESWQEVPTGS